MNMFCRRWLLALLMGFTDATAAAPIVLPGQEVSSIPALPPDTRCRLSVSNSVVDYGVISHWQLEYIGDGRVSPGTRSLTVSVVCPYLRTMSLRVEGEGSERGLRYGKHGSTRLHLRDAHLDGHAVELRKVTSAGVITESGGHRLALNAGQRVAPVIQGILAEGKTLTARLELQPVLTEDDARVSRPQRSETMLTLTLDD